MPAFKFSTQDPGEVALLSRAADPHSRSIDLGSARIDEQLQVPVADRLDLQTRIDRCLNRIERFPDSIAPHLVLGRLLENAGLHLQASRAYEDVLVRDPNRHEVLGALTRIFFTLAAGDEGGSQFLQSGFNTAERYLSFCPDQAGSHIAMAARLALVREWDTASEHLDLAAHLDAAQASTGYAMLGQIQSKLGDLDLAYQSYTKATTLYADANPDFPLSLALEIDAGYAALDLENFAAAHAHFRNGISLGDRSIETFNRYLLVSKLTGVKPDMQYLPIIDLSAVGPSSEAPIWRMPRYAQELCFQAILGRGRLEFEMSPVSEGETYFKLKLDSGPREYRAELHFSEGGSGRLWLTDSKSGNSVEFPISDSAGSERTFRSVWEALQDLDHGDLKKCLKKLSELAPDGAPFRQIYSDFLRELGESVSQELPALNFNNIQISKTGPERALLGCCDYESNKISLPGVGWIQLFVTRNEKSLMDCKVDFQLERGLRSSYQSSGLRTFE